MNSLLKWSTGGYLIPVVCSFLLLSCNNDSVEEEVIEVIEEENLEDLEPLQEGAENTVTFDGKTFSLHGGDFEDWGVEYEGSRMYAIDLYSENYDPFAPKGIDFGVYLNSPSLTSFTYGTYNIHEVVTTPGAIMHASITVNRQGYYLVSGWVSVEQVGDKYRIKWDMIGSHVETQQREKVTGHYYGSLNYWSVDE